jgi:FdhD protein
MVLNCTFPQPSPPGVKSLHESGRQLAVEEPLEIRLEYWQGGTLHRKSVSVTMRTPGQDAELATGFLFSEGILESWNQIKQIRACGSPVNGQPFYNIVRVEIHNGVQVKTRTLDRHSYTSSSCGICGKTSLEALAVNNPYGQTIKTLTTPVFEPEVLFGLPDRMTTRQRVFQETGGSHASCLFDGQGNLLCLREDVGRHNAMDKVLGWALMNGHVPLHHHMILVSGRTSFELMQKAAMGGIPVVAAVGAPSTLAVQVAREFNMTLIGFLRDRRFTIYHDPGRIRQSAETTTEANHGDPTQSTGDCSLEHSPG